MTPKQENTIIQTILEALSPQINGLSDEVNLKLAQLRDLFESRRSNVARGLNGRIDALTSTAQSADNDLGEQIDALRERVITNDILATTLFQQDDVRLNNLKYEMAKLTSEMDTLREHVTGSKAPCPRVSTYKDEPSSRITLGSRVRHTTLRDAKFRAGTVVACPSSKPEDPRRSYVVWDGDGHSFSCSSDNLRLI